MVTMTAMTTTLMKILSFSLEKPDRSRDPPLWQITSSTMVPLHCVIYCRLQTGAHLLGILDKGQKLSDSVVIQYSFGCCESDDRTRDQPHSDF